MFLENVKNLVSHDSGKTFDVIINTLKQLGYAVYFQVLNSMTHANVPQNRERIFIVAFHETLVPNHADFRLMSRRALDGLAQFPEQNLFLRGMVPLVGYKSDIVYYKRGERFAGESKYPLKKMISFALDGITSTSAAPMRLIFWIGLIWFLLAIVGAIYIIARHFINGSDVAGWASTMLAIVGFGGANLLALGVIGEYIGKIFLEVKQRPRYLIEDFINEE